MKNNELLNVPMSEIINRSGINNFLEPILTDKPTQTISFVDYGYNKDKKLNEIETLGLSVFNKYIQVSNARVSTSLTHEQIYNIENSNIGIDVKTMLYNVLINEMSQSLSKHFFQKLRSLADITYKQTYTKLDLFISWIYKIFKREYLKTYKIKNNKEASNILIHRIFIEANKIAVNCRYGPANFVILNLQLASILEDSPNFVMLELNTTLSAHGRPYLIGTIGSIQVYVNPYMKWNDNTVYLGRKTTMQQSGIQFIHYNECDVKYLTLEPSAIIRHDLILDARCAIFNIGNNPEKNYSKFIVKIK